MMVEDHRKGSRPLNLTTHYGVDELDWIPNTIGQIRKAKGEIVETRSSKKRKFEEELEDKTPKKTRYLGIQGNLDETSPSSSSVPIITPIFWAVVNNSQRNFEKKYNQFKALGKGCYGSVFAGMRRSDSRPVAIKHVPIEKVEYMEVKYQDNSYNEISEVVLMAKAAGLLCNGSVKNCGVIGLLDVYKLKREAVIVMERPSNAMDMIDYFNLRQGQIPEQEIKSMFKQVVDAAMLMHKNGVFHRDIKGDNILVFRDHGTLSIKIIDFGCGELIQEKQNRNLDLSLPFAPPELLVHNQYKAEPCTVWQIGSLLKDLCSKEMFESRDNIKGSNPSLDHNSTTTCPECNNFINQCLTIDPEQRPGLEELQHHPWLKMTKISRHLQAMMAEDIHTGTLPLNLTTHYGVDELDWIPNTIGQIRKAKGEIVETRSSKKKKFEEELEDKTPKKTRYLGIQGNLDSTSPSSSSVPIITPIFWAVMNNSQQNFEKKYNQFKALGKGCYGSVFAGMRRSDSRPVAIKHVPIEKVEYMEVKYQDNSYNEISEVVLMAKAAGLLCNGSVKNCGVIGLLDVYKLKREAVIVMERPSNAMDMIDYFNLRQGQIPEQEIKSMFKQIVDAAMLMHKNGVFHRDIKGDNILVFRDHGTLSIKIIDFGCGELIQEKQNRNLDLSLPFAPPELLVHNQYKAEPCTVWQIGSLLKDLCSKEMFESRDNIKGSNPSLDHNSTTTCPECNNFINQCLTIDPEQRPGLEELQHHPWLKMTKISRHLQPMMAEGIHTGTLPLNLTTHYAVVELVQLPTNCSKKRKTKKELVQISEKEEDEGRIKHLAEHKH